jgi:RsiW-degrading membrane proteinase PrsW (M82 family)
MNGDAPPPRTVADRLTERLSGLDHGTNGVHDALNRAVPWLWWPLTVPAEDQRLTAREHALYAVHAGLGIGVAGLLGSRRGRIVAIGGIAAVASWALFTGAWDRRADQADSWERRDT